MKLMILLKNAVLPPEPAASRTAASAARASVISITAARLLSTVCALTRLVKLI